jgi:arabinose-5-phosphate isomerase
MSKLCEQPKKAIAICQRQGQNQLMPKIDAAAEVKRVLQMEGDAILKCAERLQQKDARDAVESTLKIFQKALEQGGKIVVTGLGKSGKIGQKIAATLCSTGSLAVYLHPTEGLHGDLGLVSSKDAVLALSYTGNTDEVVRLMPSLKQMNVPVIGVGGNSKSKLAELSNVWIDASVDVEACPHNLAPTSSTTLALAIGDALAMALMQLRGFDSTTFAQNHPGGSLGRRLNLRVADVMHQGDAVPCVTTQAPVDEVLMVMTQKRLGAVLVVDQVRSGSKLVGIVTEGDIRRALAHREKFFTFKTGEIMTANPVTVKSEQMAQEALELMENRPFQISVLPVVDSSGNWQGLIRLHDLVRAL